MGEDRVASFITGVVGGTLDLNAMLPALGDENCTRVACTRVSMAVTFADRSWRREKTLLITR